MSMVRALVSVVALVVLAANGLRADEVRREIRFPDIPGLVTLKCDFHLHTVFSDGDVWPTVRVVEAWSEGLDVIALTDHLEILPHKQDLPPVNFNRPTEIAREPAAMRDLLLVRGAEMTRDTPPGHHNFLFLEDANLAGGPDVYVLAEAAVRQKAFVMWNHPGWQGEARGHWGEVQTKLLERGQLHGIEICNGDEYYAEAHGEAIKRKLTLLGNSDMHKPSPFAEPTPERHRTMTLAFAGERSLPALREALDQRRTAVWWNNQIIGSEEILRPLFAACVKVRPVHYRTGNALGVAIENRCELDITLEGLDGRPNISLPAGRTTLVRLDVPASQPAGPAYRATNFVVAPGRSLEVTLTPAEPTREAEPAADAERPAK